MKDFRFILLAVLAMAFAGCNMLSPEKPDYRISDLQGLWEENNTQHYVRFTTERTEEYPYFYGREWDEAEDVYERDLLDYLAEYGIHGNGWFEYKFETNGNLTEIHLMDNGGAEIPKVYVVTALTDTKLEYYEKDFKSNKYYFSKIVESK